MELVLKTTLKEKKPKKYQKVLLFAVSRCLKTSFTVFLVCTQMNRARLTKIIRFQLFWEHSAVVSNSKHDIV